MRYLTVFVFEDFITVTIPTIMADARRVTIQIIGNESPVVGDVGCCEEVVLASSFVGVDLTINSDSVGTDSIDKIDSGTSADSIGIYGFDSGGTTDSAGSDSRGADSAASDSVRVDSTSDSTGADSSGSDSAGADSIESDSAGSEIGSDSVICSNISKIMRPLLPR